MRLLLAVLALSCADSAQAQVPRNIRFSGGIEFQGAAVAAGRSLQSYDFAGQSLFRARLGAMADLNADASARVDLYKNNRLDSASGVRNDVGVGEAALLLRGVAGLDHVIGRQYYGEPGDLLVRFGPSPSHVLGLPVAPLDAWRVDKAFDRDRLRLTAVAGKLTETNSGGPLTLDAADNDRDLAGLEARLEPSASCSIGLRLYQTKFSSGTLIGNARLYAGGIVLEGRSGALAGRAELLRNFGQAPAVYGGAYKTAAGMAVLLDASYLSGAWLWSGQFGWGSGDNGYDPSRSKAFVSVNSDYRPGLVWGGLSGIGAAGGATSLGGYNTAGLSGDGVSGLETFNAGFDYSPERLPKLRLGLRGYWFSRSRSETLRPFTDPFDPSAPNVTSRTLGDELDLTAVWKHSEDISLSFGYGMFLPGSGLKEILTVSLPGLAGAPPSTPFFLGSAKVQLYSAAVDVKF